MESFAPITLSEFSLAYEATAAMLMQPVASVGMADMLDATREIANMIGAYAYSRPLQKRDPLTVAWSFLCDSLLLPYLISNYRWEWNPNSTDSILLNSPRKDKSLRVH